MNNSVTVEVLGRHYPSAPPERWKGMDRVRVWAAVVEALRFAMDHCPSTDRRLFTDIRRCLAMSENSLDRVKPTVIDPLTPLPWEPPMNLSYASPSTRLRGSVSSMAQQKISERASRLDSSKPRVSNPLDATPSADAETR